MAGETHVTTDHDTIRQWAEERGGEPATAKGTGANGEPGVLRIHFPHHGADDSLREISWAAFFEKFEQERLAFLYQETLHSGEVSRFYRLVERKESRKPSPPAAGEGDLNAAQQALYRVMQIEDQASKRLRDAGDKAGQIVDGARRKAEETIQSARSDAQDRARGIQADAKSAADDQAESLLQEAESDIDQMRTAAEKNMDQAARVLVDWVIARRGGDG